MSIKARNKSLSETYSNAKLTMVNISDICKNTVTRIDGGDLRYALLSDDLIPNLSNLYNSLPDPSTLGTVWVSAMREYAKTQTADVIEFIDLYVEIRNKIPLLIQFCVNKIPTDGQYIAIYSLSVTGEKQARLSSDFSDVKTHLSTLIGLIE